jgi:hypothetical protein
MQDPKPEQNRLVHFVASNSILHDAFLRSFRIIVIQERNGISKNIAAFDLARGKHRNDLVAVFLFSEDICQMKVCCVLCSGCLMIQMKKVLRYQTITYHDSNYSSSEIEMERPYFL